MRRLSARSDIFVQSSFGLALALKALLVLWATANLGVVELAKEQAYSFGRCMMCASVCIYGMKRLFGEGLSMGSKTRAQHNGGQD